MLTKEHNCIIYAVTKGTRSEMKKQDSGDMNIHYTTEKLSEFYTQNRIKWEDFYPSERTIISELKMNDTTQVLDIGCGCGGLGLALRDQFGVTNYTGIEIHEAATQAARQLYPDAKFINADVLSLDDTTLRPESFDSVFSFSCIDWNLRFEDMFHRAFSYVKPGGHFVSSFRLTLDASINDIDRSYQFINFDGDLEGEKAPYVVLNMQELVSYINLLSPSSVSAFGYYGKPSGTAVTPFKQVCFVVLAIQKSTEPSGDCTWNADLPDDFLRFLN